MSDTAEEFLNRKRDFHRQRRADSIQPYSMQQRVFIKWLASDPVPFETFQKYVLGHLLLTDKYGCVVASTYNHLEQCVMKRRHGKVIQIQCQSSISFLWWYWILKYHFCYMAREELRIWLSAYCANVNTQAQIPSTQANTWWSHQPQAIWGLRRHRHEGPQPWWLFRLTRKGFLGSVRDSDSNKKRILKRCSTSTLGLYTQVHIHTGAYHNAQNWWR